MSHTPGTWIIETDTNHPGSYTIKGVYEDFKEAYLSDDPQSAIAMNKQDDANMRLIAAAPELLRVCRDALDIVRSYEPNHWLVRHLNAVIRKAEGV